MVSSTHSCVSPEIFFSFTWFSWLHYNIIAASHLSAPVKVGTLPKISERLCYFEIPGKFGSKQESPCGTTTIMMEMLQWSIGLFHIVFYFNYVYSRYLQINWGNTWYLKYFEMSEVIRIQFWVIEGKIMV